MKFFSHLPSDVARCDGVICIGALEQHWRKDCENCLRRTAKRWPDTNMIDPPPTIEFECEYLIEDTYGQRK